MPLRVTRDAFDVRDPASIQKGASASKSAKAVRRLVVHPTTEARMTRRLRMAWSAAVVAVATAGSLSPAHDARAQARHRVARLDVDGDGLADVVVAETDGRDGQGRGDRLLVHRGGPGGLQLAQTITTLGAGPLQVADLVAIGDVDGDGRSDVLVVDARHAEGHVLLGTSAGLDTSHAVVLSRPDGEDNGVSWAAAGDVNGDGRDDVAAMVACVPAVLEVYPPIVIACRDASRRHLYVWHGAAGGPAPAPSFTLDEAAGRDGGQVVLASVGDLDHDGFADLGRSLGSAFVVHRGSAGGLARQASARLLDRRGRAVPVQAVARSGDTDGDGIDDLAVLVYDDVRTFAMRVRGDRARIFGRSEILPLPRGAVLNSSIATGDLDGDALGDIAIATFVDDAVQAMLVYRGAARIARPTVIREPARNAGQFAIPSCPGDVDGDGAGDLVVGSPISGWPVGGDTIGRVYVYRGSPAGVATRPTATLEGSRGAHGDLGLFLALP